MSATQQSIFVVNERIDRSLTYVTNRAFIMNRERAFIIVIDNDIAFEARDDDIAFSTRVSFKRSLQNITITTNNEIVTKKRKVERSSRTKTKKSSNSFDFLLFVLFTHSTKNTIDTTIVRRKSRRSSKAKNKSRESRVDSHALFASTRSSQLVILLSRRFIRRAQMKTTRRLLFELNVEFRALHETFLRLFELSKNEEMNESSQENYIAKALRDLRLRFESQSIANMKQRDEEQQSKTHVDDFVQLSQFLKKNLDSKTIASIAKITRDRANAFYRDERSLRRK